MERKDRYPISRKLNETIPVIQSAFQTACLQNGYDTTDDMNGTNPTGVALVPMNNQNGVRMSTAITHLGPMRHQLNLTIRGNVFVQRVLTENGQVTGVEVESGGEVFTVESNKVVLSAGALKSPHILMLSGIGPKDQLEEFGIPVIQDTPGVGANLRNHPISPISYKIKEGIKLAPDAAGARVALRYTAKGSKESNDMMMTTSSVFNPFTRHCWSTTAMGSESGPILQVPETWRAVPTVCRIQRSRSSSLANISSDGATFSSDTSL